MIDGMNENQEHCYLRLPCGICRLTMTDCPKVSEIYSITSTWVSTNCEVNSTGTGQKTVIEAEGETE